ncbi:acyl-[acyl-carrier-protein] thioesterase [Rubrivirga sp.]|uniref:acyl-[acyl-carrier-protein] thioesterase n=1 Tax=Rubrivirga sp. TaxID=1885344 RepID=UPI003B52F559
MSDVPLVWTEPFAIRATEVGPDETASALTICDLLQEAAGEHARASGREGFPLAGGGWATWVMSRLRLRVGRRPAMRERVAVETWPSALDGLRATRDFRVTGADSEALAVATSLWFLIDVARRRPVRLPPAMDGFEATDKPRALTLGDPPEPPATVEHARTFAVRRSDLDRVGHANNARFVEWAIEALPEDAGLREVDVLYRSEAVVGDDVVSDVGPLENGSRAHRLLRASDGRLLALARTTWT